MRCTQKFARYVLMQWRVAYCPFARRCNCKLLGSNVETCRKSDVVVRGVFQAFLSSRHHCHGSLALMIGDALVLFAFHYLTALIPQAIPLLHGRSDGQLCSGFVFNKGSLVWLSDAALSTCLQVCSPARFENAGNTPNGHPLHQKACRNCSA